MNRSTLKKILKKLENGTSTLNEVANDIIKLENPNSSGSTFNIDFFEFSFLVEACIPPTPIARSMFWDDVIDKHYHTMSENERQKLFSWMSRNISFQENIEKGEERTKLFAARFDRENQYLVTANFKDTVSVTECFKLGDRYWTGKNTFIANEFITKIEKRYKI